MENDEFQKIVDKEKYQIFLFVCPCSVPLNFALHSWFVTNKKGSLSRWEVLYRKNVCATSWGHLHLNFTSPSKGLEIFDFSSKFFWKSKLIGSVSGDEDSYVKRMIDAIEKTKDDPIPCYEYSLTGRNSNTFTQSIIDQFLEFNIKLPWNCFGRNYLR
jgi:hypothetical protein